MERLLSAETSSDLSEAYGSLGDVDFLRAAGMTAQHFPAALSAWRYTELGDKRAGRAAFDHLVEWLVKHHRSSSPVHTAASVLSWLADKVCPVCTGRRFEAIPGTPSLSERPCPACQGTGERPKDWGAGAYEVAEWLAGQQRVAAAEIIRRLHG